MLFRCRPLSTATVPLLMMTSFSHFIIYATFSCAGSPKDIKLVCGRENAGRSPANSTEMRTCIDFDKNNNIKNSTFQIICPFFMGSRSAFFGTSCAMCICIELRQIPNELALLFTFRSQCASFGLDIILNSFGLCGIGCAACVCVCVLQPGDHRELFRTIDHSTHVLNGARLFFLFFCLLVMCGCNQTTAM